MSNLYDKLKTQFSSQTDTLIANYVLSHLEEIPSLTTRQLAAKTFTNSMNIVRFCRRLGYDGYNDFKINLVHDISLLNPDQEASLNANSYKNLDKVGSFNNLLEVQLFSLNAIKNLLSINLVDQVGNRIIQAEYVDIFSIDINEGISEYASHNFFSCGKISNNYHSLDKMARYAIINPDNKHVAIFISKTGENQRIVKIAKKYAENGNPPIIITSNAESTLAKLSSCCIVIPFLEDLGILGEVCFTTSLKCIFDLIFSNIFSKNMDELNCQDDELDSLIRSLI